MITSLLALDWSPFYLTFKLALIVACLILPISILILYLIRISPKYLRLLLEVLLLMPLVLPPSVFGFYFLVIFNPQGLLGQFIHNYLGFDLVFSFAGLVLGSIIFSLPFMLQPMQAHLQALPKAIIEAAFALGGNKKQVFFRIELPMVKISILLGMLMSFAHTIGEFGLILMIGGNIPNKTQLASIAIYQKVENLDYTAAHIYAGVLVFLAFIIIFTCSLLKSRIITK